jgi:cytochrome c1
MKMNIIKTSIATLALFSAVFASHTTLASGETPRAPKQEWSFNGLFGTYDRASAQRGFQVYKEVCSGCHGMNLLSYRHLNGIGFSEAEIKAIAATVEVQDGPDSEGDMFDRPGMPADQFLSPFPNVQAAAAANGGKAPPRFELDDQGTHWRIRLCIWTVDRLFGCSSWYRNPRRRKLQQVLPRARHFYGSSTG